MATIKLNACNNDSRNSNVVIWDSAPYFMERKVNPIRLCRMQKATKCLYYSSDIK